MGEAEDRILEMLSEGTITAEEAEELLAVLDSDDLEEPTSAGVIEGVEVQDAKPHSAPPDLSRFRRWWRIPLFIAAISAVISGAGLVLMYQAGDQIAVFGFMCIWSIFIAGDQIAVFGFMCIWSIFIIALFTTVILLITSRSTWFYINVEEKDGSHFTFGMPMPLGWVNWIVKVARPFVPQRQAAHLETAGAFVSAMKDDPEAMPIVIDVDDEDGDKVEIFIG